MDVRYEGLLRAVDCGDAVVKGPGVGGLRLGGTGPRIQQDEGVRGPGTDPGARGIAECTSLLREVWELKSQRRRKSKGTGKKLVRA